MRWIPFCIFLFSLAPAAASVLDRARMGQPQFMGPVLVDSVTLGDVWMFPRLEKRAFYVDAAALLKLLKEHLPEDELRRLGDDTNTEGVLELRALEARGLDVRFDDKALELRIQIPLKIRKAWMLNLNRWKDTTMPMRPALPSGYLGLRLNQGFQYESSLSADSKLPLGGRVDFVHQNSGFVLESGGIYTEHSEHPWVRQDTRVVFDNEREMLRYQLGDLSPRTRGFQAATPLGGFSMHREFAIQPERTATRISASEILLKRASLVEIRVNGTLFTQLRLPSGRFNLREIPLLAGQNRISVKVRDDFGEEETFEFDLVFDALVLGAGEHEFAYQAGAPSKPSGSDRIYDSQAAFLSLFHRMGVSDSLTFGTNFQNYTYRYLLGVESVKATSWALFGADLAASRVLDVGGVAGRVRLQTLDRIGDWEAPARLLLSHEEISENFYPVMVVSPAPNEIQKRTEAQLSKSFGPSVSAGVGAGWESAFIGAQDRRSWRANLITSITRRLRVEFSFSRTEIPQKDDRGLATLTWNDEPGRYSVSAYHDNLGNTSNVTLNRSNLQPSRDFRGHLSHQKDDDGRLTSFGAEYLASRGSLRLDHLASVSTDVTKTRSQTTHLGLNTGVVWVGGEWALSEPVSDSFVLIAAENFPEDQVLKVNPNGEYALAELGPRPRAVLKDLSSYSKFGVNLDSTSLPPGYLLDREYYLVQPSYRSGLLITLDLTRKILVRGRLLGPDGQAVGLTAGEILDEQERLVDNDFFTNRGGQFFIEGLEPGTYWIAVDRSDLKRVKLTVPSDRGQTLDLGQIRMEER